MKHIAVICKASHEFHSYVSNRIGQKEYADCIKSNFLVCHGLTKYHYCTAPMHLQGIEWDEWVVPEFQDLINLAIERTRSNKLEVAGIARESNHILFEEVKG